MQDNLALRLREGLQALSLELAEITQTQLLHYLALLAKWNRAYNLTAVRDIADMLPKHVFDSLSVISPIQNLHFDSTRPLRLLDVGTGAGLPGLLLAIARPEWHCVLLDSNAKKIRFVQQAVIELHLTNVETVCVRTEQFTPIVGFDSVITRAYSSLYDFYQQTAHLCQSGGCLLAMKGQYPEEELATMANLSIQLDIVPLHVPQLSAARHLVVMCPDGR